MSARNGQPMPPPSCIPGIPTFSGTLIIVGAAKRAMDDLRKARALRRGAHIMLINEAAGLEEDANHLLAGHTEKADLFVGYRFRKFQHAPLPHTEGGPLVHAKTWEKSEPYPKYITHLWRNVACGASSAWVGVRIGKAMGYSEIILAGCPMDDSGYFNEPETGQFKHACARLGHGERYGNNRMYHNYRASFKRHAEREGQNVYSMSGYSQQLLGAPPC